jgi:hAT family protein
VNTFAYPLMAQAVRDFLPVPSAEVAIERVFSGGRVRHAMANAE